MNASRETRWQVTLCNVRVIRTLHWAQCVHQPGFTLYIRHCVSVCLQAAWHTSGLQLHSVTGSVQQTSKVSPCHSEWDEMWEIRRQLGEALTQQLELNCSVQHWAPCGTVSGVCTAIFTVLGGKGYRGEPPWTQSSCANTGRELIVFIFNKGRVYNRWLLTRVPTLSCMQDLDRLGLFPIYSSVQKFSVRVMSLYFDGK